MGLEIDVDQNGQQTSPLLAVNSGQKSAKSNGSSGLKSGKSQLKSSTSCSSLRATQKLTERLYSSTQNKENWIKNQKILQEQKELKECKFKPKINKKYPKSHIQSGLPPTAGGRVRGRARKSKANYSATGDKCYDLYLQAKKNIGMKDKTSEEIDYEKSQNELTFKPDLRRTKQSLTRMAKSNSQSILHDVYASESISRVREASKQRETVQIMKDRGVSRTKAQSFITNTYDSCKEGHCSKVAKSQI